MSEATYHMMVDHDHDGYFNFGVDPSDPQNLIHQGATWHGIILEAMTADTLVEHLPRQPHASSEMINWWREVRVEMPDLSDGVWIGKSADAVFSFPVLPNTQYTWSLTWAQEVLDPVANTDMEITIYDQDDNVLANDTQDVDTRAPITFTTDPTSTSIYVEMLRLDATPFVMMMSFPALVLGANVPIPYNAGVPSNALDNIMRYVEDVSWNWGIPSYSDAVAPPSQMIVTLNNIGGEFTPENSSSPLYPITLGTMISFNAEFGFLRPTNPLFNGIIQRIQVMPGAKGGQRAMLFCTDPSAQLQNAEFPMDIMLDVRTDEVLSQVFDQPAVIYPYGSLHWLVGVEGSSELGESMFLFEQDITDFEEGDTTHEYAGDIDGAGQPVTADKILREYTYAEMGGRLFWNHRLAQFTFYRRSHDILTEPDPITLNSIELDDPPQYIWGDDLVNHFTLNFFPRKVGPANSVIYSASVPFSIAAGGARRFTARYALEDAPDAQIGLLEGTQVEDFVDFTANTAQDGSGSDRTGGSEVNVTYHATSAEVTILNQSVGQIYVTLFQLRGTPLTAYQRDSSVAFDGASIAAHGERKRSLDYPALGDRVLAASFSNYLLQRYKNPLGRFRAVSLWGNRSNTVMEQTIGIGVGDVVEVFDSVVNNQITLYTVTALQHSLSAELSHHVRLILEPLTRNIYWILGDADLSILDETTRLAAI